MITRRHLLAAAGASSLAAPTVWSATAQPTLLILGGTGFIGPHIVWAAQAAGYEVTLFNRGKTEPGLFPELETLTGNRQESLEPLKDRKFDVVIDTSGYVPRHVQNSAEFLAPNIGHYLFISTLSVYQDFALRGLDERYPVGKMEDPTVEEVTGETYGPLKALCETAVRDAMGARSTILRPGLIVGPRDKTDRFSYWPIRVAKGGDVAAPNAPSDATEFIDARDLADFVIRCADQRLPGNFNLNSPRGHYTIGQVLETCRQVSGSDARFEWIDSAFLEAQEIQGWSHMPAWVPNESPFSGIMHVSSEKAVKAGLQFTDLTKTVADTLNWFREQPEDRRANVRAGMTAEQETNLLNAWRAHKSA